MSVGKDRNVLGAIPMLTSAVPSDALNRTPVYKGKSSVICQEQLFNLKCKEIFEICLIILIYDTFFCMF